MKQTRKFVSVLLVALMMLNLCGSVFAVSAEGQNQTEQVVEQMPVETVEPVQLEEEVQPTVMEDVQTFAAPQQTVDPFVVTADKTEIPSGETVTLTINGPAVKNVQGVEFTVEYNLDEFEYVSHKLVHSQLKRNLHRDNWVQFGVVALEPFDFSSGEWATITLRAKKNSGTANLTYLPNIFFAGASEGFYPDTNAPVFTFKDASAGPEVPVGTYALKLNANAATVNVGTEVTVGVSVASETQQTYNAYDIKLSYDANMQYVRCDAKADEGISIENDPAAHTLHIVGYGQDKALTTAIANLVFKPVTEGQHTVTATAAKVDAASGAIEQNAPDADVTNASVSITAQKAMVKVTTYIGPKKTEATTPMGQDYEIQIPPADPDGTTYKLNSVEVGSKKVPLEQLQKKGSNYVLPGNLVTGDFTVSITIVKPKPKEYLITFYGDGAEDVVGGTSQQAPYDQDFTFTVTKNSNYDYTVNANYPMPNIRPELKDHGNGTYTIMKVQMPVRVEVTKTPKTYTVTAAGDATEEIVFEKTATYGTDYSFTVNKAAGFEYTVTVTVDGQAFTGLVENGKTYTVPGEKITGNLVITMSKTKPQEQTVIIQFGGSGKDDANGAPTAVIGKPYTFNVDKKPGYDYEFFARAGQIQAGYPLDVTDNQDGTCTIQIGKDLKPGSRIVIGVIKKAKTFSVTFAGSGKDAVVGELTATCGKDYTFQVKHAEGYDDQVTASVGGQTVALRENQDHSYTLAGEAIIGEVVITVNRTAQKLTVSVSGTGAKDVKAPDNAEYGKDYTFTVNKVAGFDYQVEVQVNGSAVQAVESPDGTYTVPADAVKGALTITVTKTAQVEIQVDVHQYVKIDGQIIWLVTATTTGENVLNYGADRMFWSEAYHAYCWLVISGGSQNQVLTEARAKVVNGQTTEKIVIDHSGDVNMTQLVDVNDAQLTYNIYNAQYANFEQVSMEKFLRADVNTDKRVDVADATAIINQIKQK